MKRASIITIAVVVAVTLGTLGSISVRPAHAAFPGRNGKIAFYLNPGATHHADIYTTNARGRHLRRVTSSGLDYGPAFSPSGRKIVFEKFIHGSYDIYTVRANGTHERRVVHTERDEVDPAFSPSGKKIVFSRNDDSTSWNIYSVRASGSHLKRLTHTDEGDNEPEFSPNGKRIVFNRNADIAVMRADGSNEHRLTHTPFVYEFGYTFSPNGKRIAYARGTLRNPKAQIYKMKSDGSHRERLTHSRGHNGNPAFSPSGRKIVFDSDRRNVGRGSGLYVMRSDGSDERRLTDLKHATAAEPDWGVRP